jgi:RNA polymerase sigma factor (sigma-70 family)
MIQAAQAGRRDAQAELLRTLQDAWFRLSLGLLGDAERAREATQETAVRFLRELPRFGGRSSLKTWALGIALNVVREMRRQHEGGSDDLDLVATAALGPEAQAELAEERAVLSRMLGELPERQREALLLRFFEDLSVEETAAAMRCAAGTVKATVHQALRAMRRAFAAIGSTPR